MYMISHIEIFGVICDLLIPVVFLSNTSGIDDNFYSLTFLIQGGHKPGKHGKPGKLREYEKLSKSQGKLREILIFVENLENSGKM